METTTTVQFADAARSLSRAARSRGLGAPTFRSPPRVVGVDRSLRRHGDHAVVAVRLRGRPWVAVAADMVEGVIVANRLEGPAALRVPRRALVGPRVLDRFGRAPVHCSVSVARLRPISAGLLRHLTFVHARPGGGTGRRGGLNPPDRKVMRVRSPPRARKRPGQGGPTSSAGVRCPATTRHDWLCQRDASRAAPLASYCE